MPDVWKRLTKTKFSSIRLSPADHSPTRNDQAVFLERWNLSFLRHSIHQRWLDTSISKKSWAVVVMPTIALLVCFLGLVDMATTSTSNLGIAQSSFEAQAATNSVLSLSLGADAGVRGYLLTRDASFLAPVQTAKNDLTAKFATISSEVAGDKSSHALLSQLQSAVASEMTLISDLQQLSPSGASREVSLMTQERQQILKIQNLSTSLDNRISSILLEHDTAVRNVVDIVLWIAIATIFLGLAMGIAVTQLAATETAIRIRSLHRSAQRLSRGEPPERLPAAKDEIGNLAEAISQASNLMEARELALKEESVFFEHLVSASPVVKFQSTNGLPGDGFVSSNLDRVFSLPAKLVAVDGNQWLEAIDPEDRQVVVSQARNAILNKDTHLVSTYRVRGKDRIQKWVYSTVKLSYGSDEGPVTALGVLIDVTESRQAAKALGEREEMLRALFDASPDALIVINKAGRIRMASKAFVRLTGEPLSNPDSMSLFHYLDPRELVDIEEQLAHSLSNAGATLFEG